MTDVRPASLGMYDFPPLPAVNDALWATVAAALRAAGVDGVPARLERDRKLDALWTDGRLLLAQTCGWPLMTTLAGRVTLVATPHYALPGCDGPRHRSFVVVRRDDAALGLEGLRGRRLALNGRDSNTGMNLLRALVAPWAARGRFFGTVEVSGAHVRSLEWVTQGRADAAAIDCVTFGLLARHRPEAVAGVRVVAETPPGPALPFITRADAPAEEVAALRAALVVACGTEAGAALRLTAVSVLPLEAYRVLTDMAQAAAGAGYPDLA